MTTHKKTLDILYRFADWAKDRDDKEFISQLHGQISRIECLESDVLNLDELQDLASRTLPELEENNWFRNVAPWVKVGDPMGKTAEGLQIVQVSFAQKIDFIHAIFGLTGELGELVDPLKRNMFYGKPMDEKMWANVVEEVGDLIWYIVATLCRATNTRLSDLAAQNIAKLRKRYPDKYTHNAALARADKQEAPPVVATVPANVEPVGSESGKTIVAGYFSSTATLPTREIVSEIELFCSGTIDKDNVARIIQNAVLTAYNQGYATACQDDKD